MQNVIIEPDVMAPANAHTSTAAIGCVDPSTAPKRPATMAKTIAESRERKRNYTEMKMHHFSFELIEIIINLVFFYLNQLDFQSFQLAVSAATQCIQCQRLDRSEIRWLADIDSRVLHKQFQKRLSSSTAMTKWFRAESMCMTDYSLHSICARSESNN